MDNCSAFIATRAPTLTIALMKRIVPLLFCTIAASASAQSFQFNGFISAREIYVKAQPSWTQGGFGRFDVGAANADDHRYVNIDVAQLGLDWSPATWLLLHADGLARKEQSGTVGRHAGILQAFVDLHSERLKLRLRGGAFWLPTSRENVDPLWTSRYTITFSALNTWIGEEVRPVGADLQFSPSFYFSLGATAFRGNDTMGTQLSNRGWAFGNRLSVYGEKIAQPDGESPQLAIGTDLDHKNGYSERIRVSLPERAMLQVTHLDNRAEIGSNYDGQTPWLTKFNIVGGEIGSTSPTTAAAEWMSGSTAVGFPGGTFTMNFDTAYLLVSQKSGPDRWTARVERFTTRSRKRTTNDLSREDGHAFTIAWLRESSPHVRSGVEYVRASGNRPGAPDPRTAGSTITVEVRYRF